MENEQRNLDETLLVTFYEKEVTPPGQPLASGVKKVYVRIQIPGDQKNIFEQPAREEHIKRFPRQYDQFTKRQEQIPEGMAIERWEALSTEQVILLRSHGIRVVEQFASMSDVALQRLGMGARELQQKAKTFLASQNSELDSLKARLAELEGKRKPGRPPREAVAP